MAFMQNTHSEVEESIKKLTRQICDVINQNPLGLEEKLAAVVMANFEVLIAIPASGVRMNVSDGHTLFVELKQPISEIH